MLYISNMYLLLPDELLQLIFTFIQPSLTTRCINRKYLKKTDSTLKFIYPYHFNDIYYLQSLRIKPTYKSLCLYFPQHIGFTITQKQQCQGYTKKGNRCTRYCYGKLCYHHKNTLYMYKNSKMFHYLMKDVL